jgi:carboxylesterase
MVTMTAPVLPGAEPFSHDVPAPRHQAEPDSAAVRPDAGSDAGSDSGPRIGVLLCHGFTGSPQSLRPWAEHLAAAGFGVRLPRLPGHGTDWHDMQVTTWADWYAEVDKAFHELQASYDQVFVMGLSMGGTLTLRLAERHGAEVAGLVLVNASVKPDKAVIKLVPVLKHLVPSEQRGDPVPHLLHRRDGEGAREELARGHPGPRRRADLCRKRGIRPPGRRVGELM